MTDGSTNGKVVFDVQNLSKVYQMGEMEEHALTHVPYRNWCEHCIKGRAKNAGRFKIKKEEQMVPVISIDYMWMKANEQIELSLIHISEPTRPY